MIYISIQDGFGGVRNRKSDQTPNGDMTDMTDLPGGKLYPSGNLLSKVIEGTRSFLGKLLVKHATFVKNFVLLALFVGYNAYVGLAVAYSVRHNIYVAWCDGKYLTIKNIKS